MICEDMVINAAKRMPDCSRNQRPPLTGVRPQAGCSVRLVFGTFYSASPFLIFFTG